jgi:hypothetical protein
MLYQIVLSSRRCHRETTDIQDRSRVFDIGAAKSLRATTIVVNNFQVYLCAKTFDIEPLEVLALAKLEPCCRNNARSTGFAAVFRYIHEHSNWKRSIYEESHLSATVRAQQLEEINLRGVGVVKFLQRGTLHFV